MKIFSVYDSKAEAYIRPFFSKNAQTAMRDFATAANDQTTAFHRNAGDYTLFEIGEWDEQTGVIKTNDIKTNLGTALEARAIDQVQPDQVANLRTVGE